MAEPAVDLSPSPSVTAEPPANPEPVAEPAAEPAAELATSYLVISTVRVYFVRFIVC